MWWPGVMYSLEGPNITNTRRQAGLGIRGAEVNFLLANPPLHTPRAAGCKNMAQKRDLATNLEKKRNEIKRHPNIPEINKIYVTTPFVTGNSCSTYENTNTRIMTKRQAMTNALHIYHINSELMQDLYKFVI
jgi:hypothetical protein